MAGTCVCLVAALACGGDVSGPSTSPTPPPNAAARLTLGNINPALFTLTSTHNIGGLTLKCGTFHVPWLIVESGGVSATLTRTDFSIRELDGDISARVIRSGPEVLPNAIPASGNFYFTVERALCGYDGRDFPATMQGSVDIVDARGNRFTLSGEIGFAGPSVPKARVAVARLEWRPTLGTGWAGLTPADVPLTIGHDGAREWRNPVTH